MPGKIRKDLVITRKNWRNGAFQKTKFCLIRALTRVILHRGIKEFCEIKGSFATRFQRFQSRPKLRELFEYALKPLRLICPSLATARNPYLLGEPSKVLLPAEHRGEAGRRVPRYAFTTGEL